MTSFVKTLLSRNFGNQMRKVGIPNLGSAVTVSSAASMNNVSDAEVMRQRQRWTRRWYLLVIVLLYIGLLASFSLNVSLLLRKPSVTRTATASSDVTSTASAASASISEGNSITSSADSQQGGRKISTVWKLKNFSVTKILCEIN